MESKTDGWILWSNYNRKYVQGYGFDSEGVRYAYHTNDISKAICYTCREAAENMRFRFDTILHVRLGADGKPLEEIK